ncbi:hypothetical protein [Campylobacter sp. 19-13652]|uniref:beta strand repeat-containing protein n=1 Tax=Campylobacter sp. 19-13652 TaxID=2840180 RepID=UPI001C752265|nr:hypothetical protein [Campylobacter sp. 19-13652]BCX79965.1 hypothetical protein LBC_14270 [Campylobacter sp. 19-13652]
MDKDALYPLTFTAGESVDGGAGIDTLNLVGTVAGVDIDDAVVRALNISNVEKLNVKSIANADVDLDDTVDDYTDIAVNTLGAVTIDSENAKNISEIAGTTASVTANKAKNVSLVATGTATVSINKTNETDKVIDSLSVKTDGALAVTSLASAEIKSLSLDDVSLAAALNLTSGNTATVESISLKNLTGTNASTITIAGKNAGTTQNITIENLETANNGAQLVTLATSVATTGVITSNGTENSTLGLNSAFTKLTLNANTDAKHTTTVREVTNGGVSDLTVTGTGKVVYNDAVNAKVAKIDASANTGGVTVMQAGATVNGTFGSGDDRVEMSAATTANTKLVGGAGNDTLILSAWAGNALTNVSGFEAIGGAVSGNQSVGINMNNYTGFDSLVVTDLNLDQAGQKNLTVSNIKNGASISIEQTTHTQDIVILQMAGADTDAEAVTLKLGKADATTAREGTTIASLNLGVANHDIETVNLVALGKNNTVIHTITAIDVANSPQAKFVVTGDASVRFENVNASIDASALKGTLTVDTVSASNITIKGGAGNDAITLGAGMYANIDVSAGGNDTITLVANTGSNTQFNTVTGLNAGDKITFAAAIAPTNNGKLANTAKFTNINEDIDLSHNITNAVAANTTANNVIWFNYKGNTYVIQDANNAGQLEAANDSVVKLVGTYDLSTASVSGQDLTLV